MNVLRDKFLEDLIKDYYTCKKCKYCPNIANNNELCTDCQFETKKILDYLVCNNPKCKSPFLPVEMRYAGEINYVDSTRFCNEKCRELYNKLMCYECNDFFETLHECYNCHERFCNNCVIDYSCNLCGVFVCCPRNCNLCMNVICDKCSSSYINQCVECYHEYCIKCYNPENIIKDDFHCNNCLNKN